MSNRCNSTSWRLWLTLTSDVITEAVGETFKDMGSEVRRSGATGCEWGRHGRDTGLQDNCDGLPLCCGVEGERGL